MDTHARRRSQKQVRAQQVKGRKHHKDNDQDPCAGSTPSASITEKGAVLRACHDSTVPEWRSLALIGKLAQTSSRSQFKDFYSQDHSTESDVGLELAKH